MPIFNNRLVRLPHSVPSLWMGWGHLYRIGNPGSARWTDSGSAQRHMGATHTSKDVPKVKAKTNKNCISRKARTESNYPISGHHQRLVSVHAAKRQSEFWTNPLFLGHLKPQYPDPNYTDISMGIQFPSVLIRINFYSGSLLLA